MYRISMFDIKELLRDIAQPLSQGRLTAIPEVLRDWSATFELWMDSELNRQLEAGLKDFAEGNTVPWETLKAELGL